MFKIGPIASILAGLALLAIVGTWFSQWLDRRLNAWAYAVPALTQDWQGDAVAGKTRLRLVLSLSRDKFDWLGRGESYDDHRNLSGRAVLCDSTGRVQSYSIAGQVKDKDAHQTVLQLSPLPHEIPGLRPTRIELSWYGGVAMRGQTWMSHARADGSTLTSSSDPETGHAIEFFLNPAAAQTCTAP